MASLLKKKVGKNTYYSYVEVKRINGKPRPVKQIYLGRAEKILEKIESNQIDYGKHFRFGLESALYQVADEINLEGIINDCAVGSSPYLDVGQMLTIAAINRVCEPKSKRGIVEWWKKTTLPELFSVPLKNINSRRFWDAMDRLPVENIPMAEEQIWENIFKLYEIPMDILLYDTTNFYTYMDPATESDLCKTGHNKASKHHLRQVGVAMAVGRGCGIPFLHQVYQGSMNDVSLFPTAISSLISRVLNVHKKAEEITVVFDKGNNSKDNFNQLKNRKDVHLLGSLTPSHFPELLKTRISRFENAVLENGSEVLYFSTRRKVFERDSQVVITFNKKSKKKQEMRFNKKLGEILSKASRVQWSRVKDRKSKLKELTQGRLPLDLFTFAKSDDGGGSCVSDSKAIRRYKKRFGKNIIFTTNLNMEPVEIIQCYRDRNEVEEIFGQMNDPQSTSLRPIYHWTDQKITIHAFICIIGLLLLKILEHKIRNLNDVRKIEAGGRMPEKDMKGNGQDMSPGDVISLLRDLMCLVLIDKSNKIQKVLSFHDKTVLQWLEPLNLNSIIKKLGIHIPDG